MKCYVTTCGRGRHVEESARVYLVDITAKKILAETNLPRPNIDSLNPRGGVRGARGMTFLNNELWVAGCDGLFNLDPDTLRVKQGIWPEGVADIHQIYTLNKMVYAVSTGNDSLVPVCTEGLPDVLREVLSFLETGTEHNTMCFRGTVDGVHQEHAPLDTLHFNSMVSSSKDGVMLFNRIGSVCRFGQATVCVDVPGLSGGHDLWMLKSGELAVNSSGKNQTIAFDCHDPSKQRVLFEIPRRRDMDAVHSQWGFTRGMCYLEDCDLMVVGSAPATVTVIENVCGTRQVVVDSMQITDKVEESVFDVLIHPDDWAGRGPAGKH